MGDVDNTNQSQKDNKEPSLFSENLATSLIGDSTIGKMVAGTIMKQTAEKTKSILDSEKYVNYFTPFFDIEPLDVIHRLVFSIIPNSRKETNEKDMYGPMMCVLTLMAILLMGMKINGDRVIEGTLIGSSFLISSSFWIGSSLFFYSLTYFFSINLGLAEILSKVGYSLFSYCIILLSFVFHFPSFSSFVGKHIFLFIFGGLSSFTLSKYFASKSTRQYFWVVGLIIFVTHFFFLVLFANVYSTNPNFYHHEDSPLPVTTPTLPQHDINHVDNPNNLNNKKNVKPTIKKEDLIKDDIKKNPPLRKDEEKKKNREQKR
eukprot:TRINITY_DN15389_c0_g1_i1.p1 TRINITY_DN15389_c0_g1~~TRINITY_DN15389_c0_g1_i1.p1  ORF type:complete len:337 (+),score=86.69 TRINITY_DN15389_c0_g1_i1:62-1012(+)